MMHEDNILKINTRLKPRNDFVFQRLFGELETKDSLISLLNAILRLDDQIVDLTVIDNKQLTKDFIDDKTGRLDIRAETMDHLQIDIEMQLTDQANMPRRTLFYLSKMYVESIKTGGKYENLKKTIAINIVDFNVFDISRFHSTFHFYEDHEEAFMLTDAMEVHFIEYPKFLDAEKNLHDPLHRWLLFLNEKLPEDTLKELMKMDRLIKESKERLDWLSSDAETRRLYEAREHAIIEWNSNMSESEAKGKAEGRVEGRTEGRTEGRSGRNSEIVMNMIDMGLDISVIVKATGLNVKEIEQIKNTMGM